MRALGLLFLFGLAGCGSGAARPGDTAGEARSADGTAISYESRGSGDPALVLVHGWTNTRAIWGVHPAALSRSYRVVTLDLAGHGQSGAGRTEWTMDAFGEDVVAVVEELGLDRVVLVGFSMGGAVVLEAAQQMPERVAGVVLVDSFHDPDRPIPPAQAEAMIGAFRQSWGDTAFVRAFAFTPDAPDSLIRMVVAQGPPEPAERYFTMVRAFLAWIGTDLGPMLQRVRAPVAAINTAAVPTNVEAFRRHAPAFTADTIGGVGHAGILLQRTGDFDARLRAIVQRFDKPR